MRDNNLGGGVLACLLDPEMLDVGKQTLADNAQSDRVELGDLYTFMALS